MRPLLLFTLLVLATAGVRAKPGSIELKAEGLSLPFFDEAGKPTHRLTATHGVASGGLQALRGVELVYFSPDDPKVIVQKLVAAEAVWDPVKEFLASDGAIEVTTDENTITGEGFDFAFSTALLHVHRKFTMTNREVLLTSDRATVELIVEQKGAERKIRDVKRCDAIGNLHIIVQPTAQGKYVFEEAWSTRASYDGATQIVTLPEPMRYVVKGRRGEALSTSLDLKKKSSEKK